MGYHAKSAARLGAVQALYTQYLSHVTAREAVQIFIEDYAEKNIDDEAAKAPNVKLLTNIVEGVSNHRDHLLSLITPHLKEGWSIERLDPVLLNILLCGAYELTSDNKTDTAIVINEYLDVGHAFFDKKEVSFINKVLDGIKNSLQ